MNSMLSLVLFRHTGMGPRILIAVVATFGLLRVPEPASAFQAECDAYRHAVGRVCTTKVTPEIRQLYQAAVTAIEQAKSSGRAPVNLANPRPPEMVYADCFQMR